jgi:Putative Ig domain/Concanavalin A-like lectin/glucanases superfamily
LKYDTAAVDVTIGWDSSGSSTRFNGQIDEVAVYNRALSGNEILEISNADRTGKNITQPYFTSPPQLPGGAIGTVYSQQITTVLGTSPLRFSLSGGSLPSGVTLSTSGLVAGVPSEAAIFGFIVRATDAAGLFNEQVCTLQVVA